MWYDILVVCILLFFLVKGAARGLIWQLAGIAGILLCVTFAGTASKVIGPHINLAPPTNQWAVMFITYLLASFVAFGFARTLNGWIEKLELKEFNRHLGAVFGLLKGALLVLIMTFMIVTFSAQTRGMLKDSKAAHIAAKVIQQIEPIVPDKLRDQVAKYIDMFERTGFVEEVVSEEDEAMPEGTGSESDLAPVGDDTSLGESEPFNPFDMQPQTQPKKGRTPSHEEPAVASDLATELRNTVGSKVSRLIEVELRAASPKVKARIEQDLTDALQSANPQSKRQLQERLFNEGADSSLVQLLGDWAADTLAGDEVVPAQRSKNATPARNTTARPATPVSRQPSPTPPASNGQRSILDEIVATKSQFPSIQKKLKADFTQVLQMLPKQVAEGVMQDWHGDLTNTKSDIDQGTNFETPLDERIIRQLSAARYPESKLAPELQDRLKQFRLTAEGSGVLR